MVFNLGVLMTDKILMLAIATAWMFSYKVRFFHLFCLRLHRIAGKLTVIVWWARGDTQCSLAVEMGAGGHLSTKL